MVVRYSYEPFLLSNGCLHASVVRCLQWASEAFTEPTLMNWCLIMEDLVVGFRGFYERELINVYVLKILSFRNLQLAGQAPLIVLIPYCSVSSISSLIPSSCVSQVLLLGFWAKDLVPEVVWGLTPSSSVRSPVATLLVSLFFVRVA